MPDGRTSPRALFLHTGWRSGGTWIWGRCREQAGVHAIYEPLHERLAWLRHADITALRPGTWASNHSETAPYFQEYGALLRPGVSGVPLYRRRFAFDRFFMGPDEEDAELEVYLDSLLAAARPGQACALKFCRSLGRVGWLERRFPQARHAVLLRDPVSQFASAQALLSGQRNRYFSVAPLIVLARNATHPLVRQANAALGVRPPDLHSDDLAYVTEACWRHFRKSGPGERYRQFMAFWAATALHALHSTALVLDAARLSRDDAYRSTITSWMDEVAGPGLSLTTRAAPARGVRAHAHTPLLPATELADVHLAAGVLIRACSGSLPDERVALLLKLLGQEVPAPHPRRTVVGGTDETLANLTSDRQAPRPKPPLPRRIATLVLVMVARGLQPIRRMHGTVVRWQNRLPGRSADQIT